MDDREAGAVSRRQEVADGQRERIFPRAGDAPLPDCVGAGGEGVSVIRPLAPAREKVEAANVAY